MWEKDIIELTNRVYRQTLLFPKKEPLRYRIREISDDILADAIEWNVLHSPNPGKFSSAGIAKKKDLIFEIEKSIEVIRGYFNVVKWQNWVSYFDILRIEREYGIIGDYFKNQTKELELNKRIIAASPKKVTAKIEEDDILDQRKQRIMGILKIKGSVQVKDIKDMLPEISKRTLRRDFDTLLRSGLVERVGSNNNTFYKIKSVSRTR